MNIFKSIRIHKFIILIRNKSVMLAISENKAIVLPVKYAICDVYYLTHYKIFI